MADKSFGVKDVNLIGVSGTPKIQSPNNLNVDAINVAISTDMSVGGDLNVIGVATAGTFSSGLFETSGTTGDGSDRGFSLKYYITANGSSAFRFAGPGSLNTDDNPTLYFHRGFTYTLENSAGSNHPIELRQSDGGSAYAPGGSFLTGSTSGIQTLTVPFDAPSSIVYQCTNHSGMLGTINFVS